jgi:cullin 3
LTILKDEMRSFVRESGEKIVSDEENKKVHYLLFSTNLFKNPNKFVQEVLDMRLKYFKIVSESFGDDRRFSRTLKESFEHFINLDARAAQYLSLFIDEMIKNSSKDLSEDIADQKLDQVITIFRYLSDKDVFEDFYKQHLASRLLMGKTSDDLEKSMIAKLKAECGHQFTSKMEGMFKNIDLSKEINEEFSKYLSVLP